MWGDRQKNDKFKNMGIIRKKMIPSGLSRADILQNSFKDYIKFEANKIKQKHGKFILLTTKFPKFNYPKDLVLKEDHSSYAKLHDKQVAIQKKNLEAFFKFFGYFFKKFSDKKLILRPHP